MSGKGVDASPLKSSRLKKRRRPKGSINNGTTISSLQHLNSSRRIIQSRCDNSDIGAAAAAAAQVGDGHCKENMLNGLPSSSSGLASEGREHAAGGKSGGLDNTNELYRASAPLPSAAGGKGGGESPTLPDGSRSWLGFMDCMDQSSLVSAIPSMLGIDMTRYESRSTFERDLERAFDIGRPNNDDRGDRKKSTARNGIYHPLVGRIDPHSICDSSTDKDHTDEYSIAVPRCKNSCQEANPSRGDSKDALAQHFNISRNTGHGMRLPWSWYRFPPSKMPSSSPTGTVSVKSWDGVRGSAKVDDDTIYSVENPPSNTHEYGKNLSAGNSPQMGVSPVNRGDDGPIAEENPKKQSTTPPNKYLGMIRIEPGRQATIREVFDIDKSSVVIGTLREGEERYFIRRRTLQPPPIENDDDDECVAVVRYKIALGPADFSASRGRRNGGRDGPTMGYDEKPTVGWISDRGRLADDSYLILREIEGGGVTHRKQSG
jgi:hypothetical protein